MDSPTRELSTQARHIKKVIMGMESLPVLPAIFQRIINCANSDDTSASDLKDIILQDQSVAAKVLRLSNSAYFGSYRQVSSITDAIVVLGFQAVVDLTTSLALTRMFGGIDSSDEFNLEQFWLHTLAAGEAARLSAQQMHYDNLERAYLIGLLHDLGKVVLVSVFRKDFENAIFNARVARQPLHVAERTMLDFDHADAGAWLGEKWDLPDTLLVGIQYHHDTRSTPKELRIEALLAACGNHFAHAIGLGSSGTSTKPPLPDGAQLHLKMKTSDVKTITAALEKKRSELEAVLQVLDT